MLATIVVVVISLVFIAIALVVFFRWRSSTSHVRMRNKMGVRSHFFSGYFSASSKGRWRKHRQHFLFCDGHYLIGCS